MFGSYDFHMYGPVPGGTSFFRFLGDVLPGTTYANGSASLSRNSGSEAVRWIVSVYALSSATTPCDRSQLFALHLSAPTIPL